MEKAAYIGRDPQKGRRHRNWGSRPMYADAFSTPKLPFQIFYIT